LDDLRNTKKPISEKPNNPKSRKTRSKNPEKPGSGIIRKREIKSQYPH
jgi:hypothetical protein